MDGMCKPMMPILNHVVRPITAPPPAAAHSMPAYSRPVWVM